MQVQQRLLKEKEMKIRKALERLRQKRQLLGRQRRRQEFPVIAVVGYTNCGENPSGREKWGPRCPHTPYPCAGPVCLGSIRRQCTKTVALRGPTQEHRWRAGLPSSGGVTAPTAHTLSGHGVVLERRLVDRAPVPYWGVVDSVAEKKARRFAAPSR